MQTARAFGIVGITRAQECARAQPAGDQRWRANTQSQAAGRTCSGTCGAHRSRSTACPLPDGLDVNAASAAFKNGVLTVTIPKTQEAQAGVKRIAVQQA